ncbi:tyrosine-type recombinase/integrase [Bacillus cereus]
MFLSRTGLRIGECLALQWTDVNFQKRTLTINKTLLSVKRSQSIAFGPPKNKSSNRILSLDTTTLNLLEQIKKSANPKHFKIRRLLCRLPFYFHT